MAVGFGTVTFGVLTDDGTLPAVESGDSGFQTWSATLQLASSANVDSLRAYLSIVTMKPALGMVNGGSAVIEAGAGVRSLTIPESSGNEREFDAILTALSARTRVNTDANWSVDATFQILAETTD